MPGPERANLSTPVVEKARAALLAQFRWREGHADVWRIFTSHTALAAVVAGLADPWRDIGVTQVLGVESRGFLLGGAVGVNLGADFQAVRKGDGLLPGPKLATVSDPDYRGKQHVLRMHNVLRPTDVCLLVDDWAERGAQATAARDLVERAGARFAGMSVLVDQRDVDVRATLGQVTALVGADELGEPNDT